MFTCSITLGKLPFLRASFLLFQLGIVMAPTSPTGMIRKHLNILGKNNGNDLLKMQFIFVHIYGFLKSPFISFFYCLTKDSTLCGSQGPIASFCDWCPIETQMSLTPCVCLWQRLYCRGRGEPSWQRPYGLWKNLLISPLKTDCWPLDSIIKVKNIF